VNRISIGKVYLGGNRLNLTTQRDNSIFQRSFTDQFIFKSKQSTRTNIFVQYYYRHYDSIQKVKTNNLLPSQHFKIEHQKNLSYLRLLHASPVAPHLEVYIDGIKSFTQLAFKSTTLYIPISSGTHRIDLFTSGENPKQILSKSIDVDSNHFYTIAANGELNDLSLLALIDNTFLTYGETKIRFIHLAKNNPNLDLAVKQGEGDVVFSNLKYNDFSEYLTLTPMTVNLEIRLSGTKTILFPLYKSKFEENKLYNIIAVDLLYSDSKIDVFKVN